MRKLGKLSVLIALLAAMAILQFTPAQGDIPSIPARSLVIYVIGWPFGFQMGSVKGTPSGNNEVEIVKTYNQQALLDLTVAAIAIILSYHVISNRIFESRFRLSILNILAMTTGLACVVTYFTWNHDVYIWNCRVLLSPPRHFMEFPTSKRPIWQNAIAAMFIFLATSFITQITIEKLAHSHPKNLGDHGRYPTDFA